MVVACRLVLSPTGWVRRSPSVLGAAFSLLYGLFIAIRYPQVRNAAVDQEQVIDLDDKSHTI